VTLTAHAASPFKLRRGDDDEHTSLGEPMHRALRCNPSCPAGQSNYDGDGSKQYCYCYTCAEGKWSSGITGPQYSTGSCKICAAGQYSGPSSLGSGPTGCKTCPLGKFSAETASSCTSCSAGHWSHAGWESCAGCWEGSYQVGGARRVSKTRKCFNQTNARALPSPPHPRPTPPTCRTKQVSRAVTPARQGGSRRATPRSAPPARPDSSAPGLTRRWERSSARVKALPASAPAARSSSAKMATDGSRDTWTWAARRAPRPSSPGAIRP
jgi:hypothetical protein